MPRDRVLFPIPNKESAARKVENVGKKLNGTTCIAIIFMSGKREQEGNQEDEPPRKIQALVEAHYEPVVHNINPETGEEQLIL